MTFLNGALALGAAAFAIPLIIHLLNRSRFRTIPWGAMHLLEAVVRVNSKRLRVEQLILLAIRCAIPVLLAFCLARMVLTGWQALPGDAPTSAVILLDNSYSMDAASNGSPHFAQAVDHAVDIVDTLSRGSEVAIVQTGGGPAPLFDSPVFDPQTVNQELRLLEGGYGASQTAESLDFGLGILQTMANTRRDLIVIGDFQRSDWRSMPETTIERIRRQINAMPVPPAVTLLQVGRQIEENVSVESLAFSNASLGVGQDLQVRANLRNHGPKVYPGARVLFRIDGTQDSAAQVTLGANQTAQTLFTCRFETPGSHVIEVEVAVDDQLETDNRYAAAVPVLERIDVLLVDGAPSSKPLESETDFLSVALTPFTFGRVKLSDLIETQTVPAAKLTQDSVSAARVVVLANVAKLTPDQVHLLAEYVRGGGSLLIFSGDKINTDWYNQTLFRGTDGFLPMPIGPLGGGLEEPEKSAKIVAQHFEHPALQVFNDRANGNLADAEIWKWYCLGRHDGDKSQGNTEEMPASARAKPLVMARLETGDPLIVQRPFGDGLVIQVATACDADWSNLPMRPSYLPLMQQLIATMASQVTPPCNIKAGEPVIAVLPGDTTGVPLSLVTPDGTRHTVRPVVRGTRSLVQFGRTRQPGIYTLTGPDAQGLHFVSQTSREESDPRLLDREQIEKLAVDLGAELVASGAEYAELDKTRRHGREVWRFLLFGVMGLMFAELILQQRFTRVRK